MLRLVASQEDLRQMAAEGAGKVSFRFVGGCAELNHMRPDGLDCLDRVLSCGRHE